LRTSPLVNLHLIFSWEGRWVPAEGEAFYPLSGNIGNMAKPIPKFKGRVQNGKLKILNERDFNQYIQGLEGRVVSIIVKQFKHARTGQQNRYYWGVVLKVISDHTGYETDDLHDHFKTYFLRKPGKLSSYYSTTELDTSQFTEYIDKVIRFAETRLDISVPSPDDMYLGEDIIVK